MKLIIDEMLLALFMTGATSPVENYLILEARKTNDDVNYKLSVAETEGFDFDFLFSEEPKESYEVEVQL